MVRMESSKKGSIRETNREYQKAKRYIYAKQIIECVNCNKHVRQGNLSRHWTSKYCQESK